MVSEDAYANLLKLLREDDIPINVNAETLLALGPDAIDLVIDALNGEDRRQLVNAMSILEQVGAGKAARSIPLLFALQKHEHIWVRMCSAKAIGLIGSTADVAGLCDWLRTESDVLVQTWIVSSMGRLGSAEAIDPLIEQLQSTKSSTLRFTIIRALADLGDLRVIPVIETYLTDIDRHVRNDAQEALNKLRGLEQTEGNDGR